MAAPPSLRGKETPNPQERIMSAIEVEQTVREVETEDERVFAWRFESLVRAGYSERLAHKLALRPWVDLHEAVDLVHRGCPPETAAEILL
jgi:hypothetical protein